MIVGLKIANGATVTYFDGDGRHIGGELGGSGAPAGVPVDGSAKGHNTRRFSMTDSYNIPSDFVFAYRLRRCRVTKGVPSIDTAIFSEGQGCIIVIRVPHLYKCLKSQNLRLPLSTSDVNLRE